MFLEVEEITQIEDRTHSYARIYLPEDKMREIQTIFTGWIEANRGRETHCTPEPNSHPYSPDAFNWTQICDDRVSDYLERYYKAEKPATNNPQIVQNLATRITYPLIKFTTQKPPHILHHKDSVLKQILKDFEQNHGGTREEKIKAIEQIIRIIQQGNDFLIPAPDDSPSVVCVPEQTGESPLKKRAVSKCKECHMPKKGHVCRVTVLKIWSENKEALIQQYGDFGTLQQK